MKKSITLIITLLLTLSAFCQYSQNIDSFSRKEIRKLILAQDDTKAEKLMELHQGAKFFSIIGYTIGGLALMATVNQENSHGRLIAGSIATTFLGSALILTMISQAFYSSSVKAHKKSLIPLETTQKSYIRDVSAIYTTPGYK